MLRLCYAYATPILRLRYDIGNLFREGELDKISVCKDSLLTASDGKPYKTKIYNLDVIISVGYRVKSKRGTDFRKWANKVIKDFI